MLTFLPLEEIDKMDAWEGSQLNTAKEILAYELTKLVHGEEEAAAAQAKAKSLFSAGGSDAPEAPLSPDAFRDGKVDILTMLVQAGLVPSRSEARRAVEQGGVTVDGEKVADIHAAWTAEQIGDGLLLKRGKKSFKKIVVK